ncbi:MAG: hypothetical protein H6566_04705 [Lewinellaceae bacterium]|nr:hypothetical protein [Lewinellaceae bacterium]
MPRFPNFDPSIDECLTLKISAINSWGHLKPGLDIYSASYNWSRNGKRIASIGYSIRTISEDLKRMTLDYKSHGTPVSYTVDIVGIITNLGNGKRWYFLCPHTGERCMNLICPSGSNYFYHRTAFPHLMYESQKKSKEYRRMEAAFGWMFEEDRLQQQLHKKFRKSHYRGEPTSLVRKVERLRRSFPKKERLLREFERKIIVK